MHINNVFFSLCIKVFHRWEESTSHFYYYWFVYNNRHSLRAQTKPQFSCSLCTGFVGCSTSSDDNRSLLYTLSNNNVKSMLTTMPLKPLAMCFINVNTLAYNKVFNPSMKSTRKNGEIKIAQHSHIRIEWYFRKFSYGWTFPHRIRLDSDERTTLFAQF